MSEAADTSADTFDSEFEAARAAEADDDAGAAGEGAEGGDGDGGEGEGEQPDPVKAELDKANKRATDFQKALKQERRKRQEDERKFTARLEALEKGGGKTDKPLSPAEMAAALRDDDDDPIGDLASLKKLARHLVSQTESETQADAQTQQRTQALQTVSNTMKEYENDFRELTPDYDKAAQHFMNARLEELKDTGLDGAALATAMQNDFAGIVARTVAAGKDPAEIIYNMAKRRGFTSTETFQRDAAKLETIEKGQAQSRTLSGGGSASGTLSAGKVAGLSGAAFDSAFEKLKAANRRR